MDNTHYFHRMISKNIIYKLVCLFFLVIVHSNTKAQLTIIVDEYPQSLKDDDKIFVSGNFEGWSGGSEDYQLSKKGKIYSIVLPKFKEPLQFKFTKGSWDSVETKANNKSIENRFYDIDPSNDTIYVSIENWYTQSDNHSTAMDNVHVIDEEFYMPLLDRHRGLRIYLPPGYDKSEERYPVLYMHDGQNLFDNTTAYIEEWEVDETLNMLSSENGFDAIVIGIDNGGDKRMDEYNPWNHPKYGGGEGDRYTKFIVENIKPHIDSTLRTLADPKNTCILGSSMGGLISYYAGLKYPDVFGKVGVFSPSFWIADEVEEFTEENLPLSNSKIYFLAGDQESGSMEKDMMEIVNMLSESNPTVRDHIKSKIVIGGKHNEPLWKNELAETILWLFEE